jgi:hypothetical protein
LNEGRRPNVRGVRVALTPFGLHSCQRGCAARVSSSPTRIPVCGACLRVRSSLPHPTSPSQIPSSNTVRSFSTHGQQPAAQGSSTTVSRSDTIRLTFWLLGSRFGPEVALLTGYPPIHLSPRLASPQAPWWRSRSSTTCSGGTRAATCWCTATGTRSWPPHRLPWVIRRRRWLRWTPTYPTPSSLRRATRSSRRCGSCTRSRRTCTRRSLVCALLLSRPHLRETRV